MEDAASWREGNLPVKRAVRRYEIAAALGIDCDGPDALLDDISAVSFATSSTIVFATNALLLDEALASPAGLILAEGDVVDSRVLCVKDARLAFSLVYAKFFAETARSFRHATAVVEPNALVGERCQIGAGTYLGCDVILGEDCEIGPRVTIYSGTKLGARVKVQAGAVLGSSGFGYVKGPDGFVAFPQVGTLTIGDDVEIGANTTIDRGALGETRIGRGTKIDNLVHIAHNCVIGEDVIIAAQVGMAGSCIIEDNAMLGGQAGLGERVTIGRGVMLGGQGGVLPSKKLEGAGVVFWGTPAQPVRQFLRDLARTRKG